jgi:DNA-binding PadR family transcriptional regulator
MKGSMMSIRHSLLALLEQRPMYGAQLRAEFEARTGSTWPLNVGQVYTTLARLERDGLVEAAGRPDAEGRIAYRLTAQGSAEVARWWAAPVDRQSTPRDELAIKLALAVTVDGVDVRAVVQTQRTATVRHLQDLTRLKRRGDGRQTRNELAWLLVLENLVYTAEAEVRWLDHVEAALARAATEPATGAATAQPATRAATRPTDEPARDTTPAELGDARKAAR